MICPNCNKEIEDNSKFCSQCGTKLKLSKQIEENDFNYRSNFEFEELKNLDDVTNLKISLANIEFIFPILVVTLQHMFIRDNEYGDIELNEDLYKQFIFSFITLFMSATNINTNLKERIYRNLKIDRNIFEKVDYFIPTKKIFLTGSINLLEDMITLMVLLKKVENNISNEISKENYKKAINDVLVSFVFDDFEDKETWNKIAQKYEDYKYYDGILALIKFLAKNGKVIPNIKE